MKNITEKSFVDMEFDKLKESGKKIKIPDNMKMRIKKNCVEYKAPEAVIKQRIRFNGRLVAVCACCLFLLLGIVLKHSGVFDRRISKQPTNTSPTTQISAFAQTPSSTLEQIVATTAKVFQTDRTTSVFTINRATTSEPETRIQQTESFTVNEQPTTEKYIAQGVPPATLQMDDLGVLKDAKRAAETMKVEEYQLYLAEKEKNNYNYYYFGVADCFYYPEEYLEFCESEIYVPVVDGENAEIMWMDYVPSYGSIDVGVRFNDTDSFRFNIEMSGEFELPFRDNQKYYRYLETVRTENITTDIYERKLQYRYTDPRWAWNGLGADLVVDGQEIEILSTDEVTLREFKEYLGRVKFVKIKDWI